MALPKLQPVNNTPAFMSRAAASAAAASPVAATVTDERFADLGAPRRIWAVGAINGDANSLAALHDALITEFMPGDRLVYTGNYLGVAAPSSAALDEIISFRRFLLSMPGAKVEDIAYLRGMVEEMWHKLLQLQFCPNPAEVLDWMENFGMGNILAAYNSSIQEARLYLRDRPIGLTKWTNGLRNARRNAPGHEAFYSAIKRAAFCRYPNGAPGPMLFVHSGIDPRLDISQQNDQFWWGWKHFAKIGACGVGPFERIIRGYNPIQPENKLDGVAVTLDGGAGRGGALLLTCFDPHGRVLSQQSF